MRSPGEVIEGFESCTLPLEEWHHRDHLIVAHHYLREHPQEALERIRQGIRRYNNAQGIVETPTRGYHETLTAFYEWLVRSKLDPALTREQELERVLAECGFEQAFTYYTRERLLSAQARAAWTEPDLRPIDRERPVNPYRA